MPKLTKRKVMKDFTKMVNLSEKLLIKRKYHTAGIIISRACSLMYNFNIVYTDNKLEKCLAYYSSKVIVSKEYETNSKSIVFFDSFGLSTRGLAYIYANALLEIGYEVHYLTYRSNDNKEFKALKEMICGYSNGYIHFIDSANLESDCNTIYWEIVKLSPKCVFFHGKPEDVAPLAAIARLNGITSKFQVNLTDHAFWLGSSVFDLSLEFRDYGYTVSTQKRDITAKNITKLPFYPMQILQDVRFQGLPEELEKHDFFLSGGAGYKIMGSPIFIQIVETILSEYPNLKFLFLSNDRPLDLLKLQKKYINRIFILDERQDLIKIMEKCKFYLSTFPLTGSLMTQIAAAKGKVPLTLCINESEECNIGSFYNVDDLIFEVKQLMNDPKYLEKKEAQNRNSILKPSDFSRLLNLVINEHHSGLETKLVTIDYDAFSSWCVNSCTTYAQYCYKLISKNGVIVLYRYYPLKVTLGLIYWMKSRLLSKIKKL